MTVADRLWKEVEKTDGCWLWTGATTANGYGRLTWHQIGWTVHRLAYTLEHGHIPPGMVIDHLCRVRNCVRVDHLEPVTPKENLMRGQTKAAANAAKTHCPKGHPYSGDNLRLRHGRRLCVACVCAQNRKQYLKKHPQ